MGTFMQKDSSRGWILIVVFDGSFFYTFMFLGFLQKNPHSISRYVLNHFSNTSDLDSLEKISMVSIDMSPIGIIQPEL